MKKLLAACFWALASFAIACDDPDTTTGGAGGAGGGGANGGGGAAIGGSGTGGITGGGGSDGGGGIDPGHQTSIGCIDGEGLTEGEHTFTLEALSRRYIVRLPVGYTQDKAWPLVLALHPNGGDIGYWDVTSGSQNIRSVLENDAILIVAEAIGGNWRDYDMPEDTWPARLETELAYFEQVLTDAKTELCVDEEAIFSMGFSGGGSFSGVLGCRRNDIRAIAVGGSVIYFEAADCTNTPAAWITIGTQELEPAREEFRDFFRDRAMCAATSVPTDPSPCVAYDDCNAMAPVDYCQHPDGHIWPDFGSAAMWAFFSRFLER